MEPCLLLLVARKPSHGYELSQGLGQLGMDGVAPSLVYRMLRQLETNGLVISDWDTETTAGPARRVYRITPEGRMALEDWVEHLRLTDRVLHGFLEAYAGLGSTHPNS